MAPRMLQSLVPLLIVLAVVAWRARQLSRKRPLTLDRLWIWPAILLAACALALFLPQPGVAAHRFEPMDALILGPAVLAGVVGGWYSGRAMTIEVHPENGTLMTQASPVGLLIVIALVLARFTVRTGARLEAAAWHLDVALIFDALIVFTAALFVMRGLEMYLRARRVMAQGRRGTG